MISIINYDIIMVLMPYIISKLVGTFMFDVKNLIGMKISGIFGRILQWLISKTYCMYCLGLWITLLYTGDIIISILVSFIYWNIEGNK